MESVLESCVSVKPQTLANRRWVKKKYQQGRMRENRALWSSVQALLEDQLRNPNYFMSIKIVHRLKDIQECLTLEPTECEL